MFHTIDTYLLHTLCTYLNISLKDILSEASGLSRSSSSVKSNHRKYKSESDLSQILFFSLLCQVKSIVSERYNWILGVLATNPNCSIIIFRFIKFLIISFIQGFLIELEIQFMTLYKNHITNPFMFTHISLVILLLYLFFNHSIFWVL